MIVSASRRTDIPAFFGEWFIRRIREGSVYARNPRNPLSVTKVSLEPSDVDCIVFWTKNARPFFPMLEELDDRGFVSYFLHTINPYGPDIEPGFPGVGSRIDTFLALAERVGPERAIWRYDPILLGGSADIAWHIDRFGEMAESFAGSTGSCVISFLDMYRHIKKQCDAGRFRDLLDEEILVLASALGKIASGHGLRIMTCCESVDLSRFGIFRGACVDTERIDSLRAASGLPPGQYEKDRNQRPGCLCARSVDIGAYDTCTYGCAYCYASLSRTRIEENLRRHDPAKPILCGDLPTQPAPA